MSARHTARELSRRTFLSGSAAVAVASLLAACGGSGTATDTPKPAAPTGATTGVAPTSAAASAASPKAVTASKGELKLALGFDFPAKIDALKDTHLAPYGMLESLMFQTPQNTLEPWLAQGVTNVNPTTWRVALRPNAKFWDGAPVTADDVIAAFKKNWEAFPDLKGLISPETKMTAVDARTVEFITPQPSAIFPYALTLTSAAIHKPSAPGGTDGAIMTGPYKATKLVVDNELDLELFADHWGGPPPLAKITIRFVGDPNARLLALQSGDVDMLYNFPPEAIKTLGPEIEAAAVPSGRVGMINLNVNRLPFSDRAVRAAWALGIDRTVLNTIGLDGKGVPATTLFPAISGYDTIPMQSTDLNSAKQVLDDAGWKMAADGVRAKGSDRLAFTLITYPGRADLTPYAVSMQSQLKPLGFALEVKEVQNIGDATKNANFDAAMKSNNTLPTGNPLYEYNRLIGKGGGDNAGNYLNPQVEDLLTQMRVELDPAKATALSRQVQEIIKTDVPVILLTVTPITYAFRKGKVKGYTPHPNDSYFLNTAVSVT
ncbi:MAG: ABC transporter substrate-binding protein [Thermomicrobiales bacterium]